MLAEKRLENRILRISVSGPFFFSFLLPEVSLFYSSLGLSPKNNTQRSKWKLRGRATYYRIKYTLVVDSPFRFAARKRSPSPPPSPLLPPPLSPRPFRATKHGPIVQSPFGGRFRTWFVIEFQPLSEDEARKNEAEIARLHVWSLR